jgi:hypothetical protein
MNGIGGMMGACRQNQNQSGASSFNQPQFTQQAGTHAQTGGFAQNVSHAQTGGLAQTGGHALTGQTSGSLSQSVQMSGSPVQYKSQGLEKVHDIVKQDSSVKHQVEEILKNNGVSTASHELS